MLVAASLVGQLVYDSLDWRHELLHLGSRTGLLITGNGEYTYTEIHEGVKTKVHSPVIGNGIVHGMSGFEKTKALYFNQYRFPILMVIGHGDTTDKNIWNFQITKRRVEYWIVSLLALSAFFGTVVWGYGINIYICLVFFTWLSGIYLCRPSPSVRR